MKTGQSISIDMINKVIYNFLINTNKIDLNIDQDTDLIMNGVLDSLGILELIQFVEKKYSVSFNENDLNIENFRSISNIVKLIQKSI